MILGYNEYEDSCGYLSLKSDAYVTDPAYAPDLWCCNLVRGFLPGKYLAYVLYNEDEDHIAELTIYHSNNGRHHVIYWSWIIWYEYEHKAGISFFQDVGEKLCNESMYVDDEDSYDYSPAEDDEGLLLRDGDEIKIQGITLANFERYNLLTSVVKTFMKAAPEAAREWREENEGEYGCDEFDELFEGA